MDISSVVILRKMPCKYVPASTTGTDAAVLDECTLHPMVLGGDGVNGQLAGSK